MKGYEALKAVMSDLSTNKLQPRPHWDHSHAFPVVPESLQEKVRTEVEWKHLICTVLSHPHFLFHSFASVCSQEVSLKYN